MDAMTADGARPAALGVDGGMVVNDWLCQTLADVLECDRATGRHGNDGLGAAISRAWPPGCTDLRTSSVPDGLRAAVRTCS